jgi:hypothetical protein
VFKVNTVTGETSEQNDPKTGQPYNVSKAGQLKLEGLETQFGLLSDKEIEDRALASILPNRAQRLKPEIQQAIAEGRMKQEDIDESIAMGSSGASSYYEGVENDSEFKRRLAKARDSVRASEGDRRRLVSRLKTALENHRPASDATDEIPLDVLLQDYNRILSIKDSKEREKEIADFFSNLNRVRIR